jgi:antitoxin ParD1/3/4
MKIDLTPEQEAWLAQQVKAGAFGSVQEAARAAIEAVMREEAGVDSEDCLWAKPYIDEAIAELDRGEGAPCDQVFAELRDKLAHLPN